jgi:hypothetical protein
MGVMLLAGAWLLGSRRFWPVATSGSATAPGEGGPLFGDPADDLTTASWPHLARLLQPLSWFAFVMGFALIAIAIVGPVYEPWEAPPQEPLTGYFNGQQWLENWFLAIMYAGTGVGAILLPFALLRHTFSEARGVLRVIGVCWLVTGAIWAGFGTLNYFTHIGLTINTYNASTSQGGNPAASGGTRAEASSASTPAMTRSAVGGRPVGIGAPERHPRGISAGVSRSRPARVTGRLDCVRSRNPYAG